MLDEREIRLRVGNCPPLASLRSITSTLSGLLNSHQSSGSIAEVIRRDPALSSRLLRLARSAFFSFGSSISTVEEAVLCLGMRQVRDLSLATPIIEECQNLPAAARGLNWRQFWLHSLGTAILARETTVLAGTSSGEDDRDYLAGLLHNIGRLVQAMVFPEFMENLCALEAPSPAAFCQAEAALLGWDHAQLGACWLEKHGLPPAIVTAARFHSCPEKVPAGEEAATATVVCLSEALVRSSGLPGLEKLPAPEAEALLASALPKAAGLTEEAATRLAQHAARLPALLAAMV